MLDNAPSLDAQAAVAEAYMHATFGARMRLQPIAPRGLPHFLLDRYRLWRGELLGRPMILVSAKPVRPGSGFTADFLKHRELLRRHLGVEIVILLLDPAPAAIRRQMVERGVGFLAPGSQLYIPEALLDLRERGPRPLPLAQDKVAPTTQLVIVALLMAEPLDDANLTELAGRFHVAVMSMSRVLDELEALKVAKARHVGRQRRLQVLLRGQALWHSMKDRLQSPVRKIRLVRGKVDDELAPRSGETALAHYTMLAAPRNERRAIAATRWKRLAPQLADATAFHEDGTELETWSYDPALLARAGVVDPLSLYLSVRHDPDERIAQAADQLLEPFGW